jgi:hypothetical protein
VRPAKLAGLADVPTPRGVAQLEVELGVWLETPHGRFAVFYAERQRRRVAEETIADVDASGRWPGKVVTEVTPAGPFWEAEPEHQDYLERYRHGYTCHFVRPEWVPTRRTQASAGSAKS